MPSKTKKNSRQRPKRLFGLRKSKHIRRWLVRHPWIKPIFVFNYTATLIQKIFRGYLIRKYLQYYNSVYLSNKNNSQNDSNSVGNSDSNCHDSRVISQIVKGHSHRQRNSNSNSYSSQKKSHSHNTNKKLHKVSQLDKYMNYLDFCNNKQNTISNSNGNNDINTDNDPSNDTNSNKNSYTKPVWLSGGYSAWCVVKIQSIARMFLVRKKYIQSQFLINQVSVIVIQTWWRNKHYRNYGDQGSYNDNNIDRKRYQSVTITKDPFLAALIIQLKWRSYCNKRIYYYYYDIIVNKLKGAPTDLLRSIIPNESFLLDKAAGIHIKFRLGGIIFPPKIYFKIFTHRPLCDINSFAPRNYVKEVSFISNNYNLSTQFDLKQSSKSLLSTISSVHQSNTYGNSYGNSMTKSSSTSSIRVGKKYFNTIVKTTVPIDEWYKRIENNNWRPIASSKLEELFVPDWLKGTDLDNSKEKAKLFHFNRMERQKELLQLRKKKKREWMVKAYLLGKDPDTMKYENDKSYDQSGKVYTPVEIEGYRHKFNELEASSKHKPNTNSSNGMLPPHNKILSKQNSFQIDDYADAKDYDQNEHSNISRPIKLSEKLSAKDDYKEDRNFDNRYEDKHADDKHVDLVDWSLALDFDDYLKSWTSIGTSMPSDLDDEQMYLIAGKQNKKIQREYYGTQ